jgi:hypothetical protein
LIDDEDEGLSSISVQSDIEDEEDNDSFSDDDDDLLYPQKRQFSKSTFLSD